MYQTRISWRAANNKFSYQHLPPSCHLPTSPTPSTHFTRSCIQFPIRRSHHTFPWYHCKPRLLFFFQFEIFFSPLWLSYYLLHTLSPLITNVTPLRVPLGASLPLNLRPRGKFPLMLTIGGKNNMSPAHKDKVFCWIRQSGETVLFLRQRKFWKNIERRKLNCNGFLFWQFWSQNSSSVRGHFLYLRTADTTDKYLTLSRYTKQIYDRECKHMIAQRKQQTDDQNSFLMGIILIYYVISSCNSSQSQWAWAVVFSTT